MKYKLRCLLLCFLFIFSLQGCQKETKLEKPGNLITTTKNSSKENPNIEDPVETVPITGGTTADINSSTGDESNSEIAEKDGTVDNSNIHIVNSELKKIPESIMEQFQKNGWHIYVTDADINQKFYQGKYSTVLGTTQYADKKIYIANTSQAATESTRLVILLITAMDFYQIRKNLKNCIYQKYEYISRLMMQSVSVTGKNCLPRSSGNILQILPSCS